MPFIWSKFQEVCFLPNTFCLFPTEIPKVPLRELTHASVKFV